MKHKNHRLVIGIIAVIVITLFFTPVVLAAAWVFDDSSVFLPLVIQAGPSVTTTTVPPTANPTTIGPTVGPTPLAPGQVIITPIIYNGASAEKPDK